MRRLPLLLILCIGVATPLAATLLFYFAPPSQHTARGEILPPQQTPASWRLQNGKWTLLFVSENGCSEQCRKRLCQMRQLRLMLPGHYLRLQRAWLRPENADETAPEIMASADCGESRAAAFAETAGQVNVTEGVLTIRGNAEDLPPPAAGKTRAEYLYLTDPAGIYAMRFPPQLDAYAVRKDLAKLLKLSKGRRKVSRK